MSVWEAAFNGALEVESEGAKLFSDVLSTRKPSNKRSHDDEDNEDGGFCQPRKLSRFVKSIITRETHFEKSPEPELNETQSKNTTRDEFEEIDSSKGSSDHEPSIKVVKENSLSGQICRVWLKNKYLQIGPSCKPDCARKHFVSGKPESLYSDYSFKGLKAKQQNIILSALRKERQETESKQS